MGIFVLLSHLLLRHIVVSEKRVGVAGNKKQTFYCCF